MWLPCRIAFVVFAPILLLAGCTTGKDFEVLVTVVNKADGTALSGAKVKLDSQGVEERKFDPTYGSWPGDNETDVNGQIGPKVVYISPYPNDAPHWYLKISKKGFEPVVIDIKPLPQPKKTTAKIPLNVTVEMQPKG